MISFSAIFDPLMLALSHCRDNTTSHLGRRIEETTSLALAMIAWCGVDD
jgi:hypothetical protein